MNTIEGREYSNLRYGNMLSVLRAAKNDRMKMFHESGGEEKDKVLNYSFGSGGRSVSPSSKFAMKNIKRSAWISLTCNIPGA